MRITSAGDGRCRKRPITKGSAVEIRLDQPEGNLIGTTKIGKSEDRQVTKTSLLKTSSGKHDLFIVLKDANAASVDWIRFD